MNFSLQRIAGKSMKIAALALAISLPLSAHAHRQWLLPSATVLSGNDAWVTVDAAVSNDLFYFEHFPLRLDGLVVTAPDGKPAQAVNAATGKYRSTFDVQLSQPGTYKIAVVNNGVFASYKVDGQQKRWRGAAEALAKEIPANAQELKVTQVNSRVETFATAGKPTRAALAITGSGLELHPSQRPGGGRHRFLPAAAGRQAGARPGSGRGAGRHPLSRQAAGNQAQDRRRGQIQHQVERRRHVLAGGQRYRPEDHAAASRPAPRQLHRHGGGAALNLGPGL
jgi:hypothetical protein